jgi:hypothetical protein
MLRTDAELGTLSFNVTYAAACRRALDAGWIDRAPLGAAAELQAKYA